MKVSFVVAAQSLLFKKQIQANSGANFLLPTEKKEFVSLILLNIQ